MHLKRTFIFYFSLLVVGAFSLFAQQRTGNIFGVVLDAESNPLPGVTVTLSGSLTAPVSQVTTTEGRFRFIGLSPAKDYAVRAELSGFKTEVRDMLIVETGANVSLTVVMLVSAIEEEVTVTASTPVVDAKKTTVGLVVTQEYLQSMPTARDPWVIIQMTPSVIIDRENTGGNESGHQSLFVSKGSPGRNDNSFVMDGIDIQAPNSPGSSTIYFDMDAFEEMSIVTGGSDVTVQTGGVHVNMVTRRGGSKLSLGGRYFLADQSFQASNITEALLSEGLPGINRIRRNQDWGFNIGIPLIRDKAWFWGSYGVGDVKTDTIFGQPDDTTMTNVSAKLNVQIVPQNRLEIYATGADKYKYGGGQSSSNPTGIIQQSPHPFGVPIFKIQDEHTFGDNLYLNFKYGWSNTSGGHVQVMDPFRTNLAIWDNTDERWYGSTSVWQNQGTYHQLHFLVDYFNDKLFGAAHDIKVGFEERAAWNLQEAGVYNGNMYIERNYNFPTVDFDGDGSPDIPASSNFKRLNIMRGAYRGNAVSAFSGFLSDTLSFGRFTVILGLRYDKQTPKVNPFTVRSVINDAPVWQNYATPDTVNLLAEVLPAVDIAAIKATAADGSNYSWSVWSPRFGFTWDVSGDGKTIAKLSLSQYGEYMGVGEAARWLPGGTSGWMDFWWQDNGDGVIDYSELYWHRIADYSPYPVYDADGNFIGDYADAAGTFWGGFDPENPVALTAPYQSIDKNAGSARIREVLFTLEREIFADFSIQLNMNYRKYDRYNWTLKSFPETGVLQNQSWYVEAGLPPSTVPGMGDTLDAKQHPYYYISTEGTAYSPYSRVVKRPDYNLAYYGFDLVFNKRLSNRWMLNGSLTWGHQSADYGTLGYLDPNNLWAYDGQAYSPFFGSGAGKINAYIYTRWMVKFAGLYELPYGFNAAFTFLGREGYIIDEYFRLVNYTLPNPQSRTFNIEMKSFGSERLPNNYLLNLRLEKRLRAGDTMNIYLMADVFNVFNSSTVNRREQRYHGTYYMYADPALNTFVPNNSDYMLNEILNPRITRFGVRFQF